MSQDLLEAERFRLFISRVTDYAIYMLNPDGTVASWNAGAERFKGYCADEIIGQHFSRFYTEQDREAGVPQRAMLLARTAGKFEDEGWRVRKDGTRFWASVVLDPIFGPDETLLGYTKITRDISERRAAGEALRQSEERFRLLVQGVTDYAIYMLSPHGHITNWNEGARRIKGLSFEEVSGTHFSRFYTQEDRDSGLPERALNQARDEGRFEQEGWRVKGDGSRFWAHVVIDPIYDLKGQLIGYAKITRDITDRRDAAIALERTREALQQSQKLEAIGKLTGGIAHDFNNLLNVVISGIDLLRATSDPGQARKILDGMERAAQRGSALTTQLLAFARQQPLELALHDLHRIIASFETVLRRAVPSSARLHIVKSRVAPVLTDISQFESGLLNLVINARDAIGEHGEITITLRQVQLADNEEGALPAGAYVVVGVADNGVGMSDEVQARAFEPFFTTKPVGKGTGLGLSQVYGLMQQSKGHLKIVSAPGAGTTVLMYFPVQQAAEGDGSAIDEPSVKVVVVDDQPDVLDMAVTIFRSLGYDAMPATCGQEALRLVEQHSDIRILFSDVVMPGMHGLALALAVRQMRPQVKVLLASGYMSGSLREQFGDALNDFDVIAKPYRLPELVKRLGDLV